MDKEKLGKFVSTLRKEQGMTQKDLAEKLCLTDKAVSKWERGLSFPDISMLEPMADIFNVTVLELLQGERLKEDASISVTQVQEMIGDSLSISDEEINRKHTKSKTIILSCCVALMFLISFTLNIWNLSKNKNTSMNQTAVLQINEDAYETVVDEEGKTVFVNPNQALMQMIRDYENAGVNDKTAQYLEILENSLDKEAME